MSYRTISSFNEHLKPTMGEIELLRLFALADEFKYMIVREVGGPYVQAAGAASCRGFGFPPKHHRPAGCFMLAALARLPRWLPWPPSLATCRVWSTLPSVCCCRPARVS